MSEATFSPNTAAPPSGRPTYRHLVRHRVRRLPNWPHRLLFVVFLSYLALGKGFAYFGRPPLFVGEVTLVVLVLAAARSDLTLPTGPSSLCAALFVAGGFLHTGIDLLFSDVSPIETLRGFAIAYYAVFGALAYGALAARESTLSFHEVVERLQRSLVRSMLVVIPAIAFLSVRLAGIGIAGPRWPGSGVPVLITKAPDLGVALAFCLPLLRAGYLEARSAAGRTVRWQLVALLWIVSVLLVSARSRAGLIAAVVGILVTFGVNARTVVRSVIGAATLYTVLLVTSFRMNAGGRELSARGIRNSLVSIFAPDTVTSGNYNATSDWRSQWWNAILHDAWSHRDWLSGPGWGTNLATKYGVANNFGLSQEFVALRLPHNMVIGLVGRVGFVLAALYVAVPVLAVYRTRPSRLQPELRNSPLRRAAQAGLVGGFAVGLTDVYLESPQGAIVFWVLCGALWWMAAPRLQTASLQASL